MGFYEGKCQFCGEDVGPPGHAAFFAFADLTFYPGGKPNGVRIKKSKDPRAADVTVHQACWRAYWDGVMAGRRFYRDDPEDGE